MNNIIRLLTAVAIFTGILFSQEGPLVAGEGEKKVITSGYGKNPDEALTQALRNAVEEAVGTYMTSTTRIENDDIIEDKILSLSRGFIKDFKKLAEMKVEDETKVTVAVIVTKTQILETLKASGVKVDYAGVVRVKQFQNFEKQMEDEYLLLREIISNLSNEPPIDYEIIINEPYRTGNNTFQQNLNVTGKINDNFNNQFHNIVNILKETCLEMQVVTTKNGFIYSSKNKKEAFKKLTVAERKNLEHRYPDIYPAPNNYFDTFDKPYSPYVIVIDMPGDKDLAFKFLNKKTANKIHEYFKQYFLNYKNKIFINYKNGSTDSHYYYSYPENEIVSRSLTNHLNYFLSEYYGQAKKGNPITARGLYWHAPLFLGLLSMTVTDPNLNEYNDDIPGTGPRTTPFEAAAALSFYGLLASSLKVYIDFKSTGIFFPNWSLKQEDTGFIIKSPTEYFKTIGPSDKIVQRFVVSFDFDDDKFSKLIGYEIKAGARNQQRAVDQQKARKDELKKAKKEYIKKYGKPNF